MSYKLMHADCRHVMAVMPEASVDSIVTDPPYELGFMGKSWDASGIAYDVAMWREALRVLKPGGHLLAFGGSRTYHRMAVAIEDAGFEIRDQIMWVYGSGFPKSHDISKAIDKAAGAERAVIGHDVKKAMQQTANNGLIAFSGAGKPGDITAPATPEAQRWEGWGTALKPAHEPIVVARKPLVGTVAANVLAHGTGGLNIDGCRIGTNITVTPCNGDSGGTKFGRDERVGSWENPPGRFPANLIHDGSDEVLAGFPSPHGAGAARFFYCTKTSKADRDEGIASALQAHVAFQTANGTSGKASSISEGRDTQYRNIHPTVKPTDLMRYLCRLVTPPGGTVFDPFTGSGSTGKAAMLEGFNFIGCELTAEYIPIANARIGHAMAKALGLIK